MPNVKFSAEFSEGMYTQNGCDEVEFYISANLGEEPKPLSKIASGGELSRIMLSIKSVMTSDEDAETLIFDEIDAGVSGSAAEKIALKLYQVSKGRQVICVTHSAQIAALARNHMLISKTVSFGRTETHVKKLSRDGRIKEIARIMGGIDPSDAVIAAADAVVATLGDHTLTNSQLQVYYWMEVQNFLNTYGAYAAYFGMDYTQPLDTQLEEEGLTWQQYFVQTALNNWQLAQALSVKAEEAGMEMEAEHREYLDNLEANAMADAGQPAVVRAIREHRGGRSGRKRNEAAQLSEEQELSTSYQPNLFDGF